MYVTISRMVPRKMLAPTPVLVKAQNTFFFQEACCTGRSNSLRILSINMVVLIYPGSPNRSTFYGLATKKTIVLAGLFF